MVKIDKMKEWDEKPSRLSTVFTVVLFFMLVLVMIINHDRNVKIEEQEEEINILRVNMMGIYGEREGFDTSVEECVYIMKHYGNESFPDLKKRIWSGSILVDDDE